MSRMQDIKDSYMGLGLASIFLSGVLAEKRNYFTVVSLLLGFYFMSKYRGESLFKIKAYSKSR